MHLTNVAVQKRQGGCSVSEELKWPLRHLRLYLMTQVGQERTDAVFEEIQQIVIQSLLAVQSVVTQDKHCFEIYGYDVLLDRRLKPWLIEVNASPSLQTDSVDDFKLKSNMVHDALTLVDMENRFQGRLPVTCGGCDASAITLPARRSRTRSRFDAIYDHGRSIQAHPSTASCLGCYIPESS